MRERRVFAGSGLATGDAGGGGAGALDVQAVLMVVRRRLGLFAAAALVVAAAVMAAWAVLPRSYAAEAAVEISTERTNIISQQQEVLTDDPTTTFAIDTQVEVLKSRALAERVVDRLRLARVDEFVPARFRGDPAGARQAAIDTLQKNLAVTRSGVAFAITVSYAARDPELAAAVVNATVEEYIASQSGQRDAATQQATRLLGQRINELRGQVLTADAAVERYRAEHGLLNTSATEIGSQQELGSINDQLATAQAELAEKRAAAATARAQARGVLAGQDVSAALSSDVIVQLRKQRGELSANLADLTARYGDKHPSVIQARSQLAVIDGQIGEEVKRIISGLEAQAQVAAGRVASLQGNVSRSRGELAANSAATVKLGDLQRNADAVRTLYEGYLARYRQTSTQQGLQGADARIISRADAPARPSSPKLGLFLAFALAAGLAAGAVAVAAAELLDRSLRTPDAIEAETGLATLASVPSFASAFPDKGPLPAPTDLIVDRPFSAFTESLRMLLAALRTAPAPPRVVAITSALPGEGKSTVAACLAQAAALGGQRAVLVECDARRRPGARAAQRPDRGLLEVLSGAAALDDALVTDPRTGLATLPLSRQVLGPADTLGADAMDALVADLRARFELVILDTAPVLAIAETRLIAAKADAVCYLVRWGKTPANAAAAGARLLHDAGAPLAGAVLSHVNLTQQARWSRSDPSAYYSSLQNYYS
jgi:polysaccharide biosynthesis transport protein